MLQSQLGYLPEGANIVGKHLAVIHHDGQVEFANASGPIYSCSADDRVGLRLAQAMFTELHLAGATALGRALGVDQSTVHRNRAAYREGGVTALNEERGPRGGYKLTEDKRAEAQGLLDAGRSIRAVAKAMDVAEGTVRYGLRQGQLHRPGAASAPAPASNGAQPEPVSTPAQRRVTVVFDREGWSPKSFRRWEAVGFDVMTYRKGHYEPWPEEGFVEVEDTSQSPPVRYRLAEQETTLSKGFTMREVRRLYDTTHRRRSRNSARKPRRHTRRCRRKCPLPRCSPGSRS